jgi:hypothetical protein
VGGMLGRIFVGWSACAFVFCAGCGGGSSSGGDSCGTVAPCGGNVVGTWKASDVCVTGETTSVTMAGCTATTTASPHVSGTATFNKDGTFSTDTTIDITTTISIPASCLAQLAGASCAEIGLLISATAEDAGASSSCVSASGGGCTCTLVDNGAPSASAGTYTISGSSITTTDSTGASAPSTGSYCVANGGANLHLISSTTSTGADGGPTSASVDVVLTH